MYDAYQISLEQFLVLNKKFAKAKEVEGYTVEVPNVIDRAVMTLRAALTKHTLKQREPRATVNPRGAVAR